MSQATKSKNPIDLFVTGAKQGWSMGVNNLVPNIVMAFVLIEVLKITGTLDLIGKYAGPVMALWGLPGETLVVICTAMLSQGGAVGIAANLYGSGVLSAADIVVLTPGCMMVGGLIQYIGRCLGTAGVNKRHWGWAILIAFINSCVAMWAARFIVTAFY